ncbi:hypothetical protein AJ87_12325 [Rhizobium yanglingense]|nr:hypothetical protein AJ87_12325 [Rhizobium yanglingense]
MRPKEQLSAFERLTRCLEVADGRDETPLGFAQALLVALQKRNVGADRNHAAVAGAAFVDLQPALVGKLDLGRARMAGAIGIRHAALDDRPGGCGVDHAALGAWNEDAVWEPVGLLEVGVAHHQAVILVPENEGFRRAFDRVRKALVGLGVTLREAMLLGHVHRDADHVDAAGIAADHLGAGAHPHIVAAGMAHAEDLVDLAGTALGDRARDFVQPTVFRMHQPRRVAEGNRSVGSRQAEHAVHRTRPEEFAAVEIEIPKPAAAARKCCLDALVRFDEDLVGVPGALDLM